MGEPARVEAPLALLWEDVFTNGRPETPRPLKRVETFRHGTLHRCPILPREMNGIELVGCLAGSR